MFLSFLFWFSFLSSFLSLSLSNIYIYIYILFTTYKQQVLYMQTRYSLEQKKYNITFRINLILDLLVGKIAIRGFSHSPILMLQYQYYIERFSAYLSSLILPTYFTIQLIFPTIHESITLFVTIYGSYYTISANFYFYLHNFQQKVLNFNKISGS